MASKIWITTPSKEAISSKKNWINSIPRSKKSIARYLLLVVQKESRDSKNGPVYSRQALEPGTEFVETSRIKRVEKFTTEIEESIKTTITSEFSEEILSKIGTSTKVGINLETSLSAEIQKKISSKLTKSLEEGIKTKKTFSIEVEEEKSNELKFLIKESHEFTKPVTLTTYYLLREFTWEVYLIKADVISLEYRSYLINWFDKRITVPQYEIIKNKPLFKIMYYIPENKFSYTTKKYIVAVQDANRILIKKLDTKCPKYDMPRLDDLEKLAKIAFPVNKSERSAAKKAAPAKKAAVKKAAPKKAAARKAAPAKKAPAKKAAAKKAAAR